MFGTGENIDSLPIGFLRFNYLALQLGGIVDAQEDHLHYKLGNSFLLKK